MRLIPKKSKPTEVDPPRPPIIEPAAVRVPDPVRTGPRLICIRECEIPDVGAWKSGQEVVNPDHQRLLSGHPYFTKAEEK
jgi:hypothetical protein